MVTSSPPSAENHQPLRLEQLTLEDLEAVRLLLRGASVIDWHQLDFRHSEDVNRFLRVNEFDPGDAEDLARLDDLRMQAVDYLTRNFDLQISPEICEETPTLDLFLVASQAGRQKMWACIILKVMHIIHHLAGRELSTRLSMPLDELYRAIELKVMRVVDELRHAGYPIAEFEWSRKSLDSLVTKLLAKRSTLAASIYDKLRFRMIVRDQRDLVPVIAALHRRLVPFNYVIPGESVNHLISFNNLIRTTDYLRSLEQGLQHDKSLERRLDKAAQEPINEFSDPGYRIVNFVTDLPVRVDSFAKNLPPGLGRVVFVLTEFQIADSLTARENETGASNHDAYKERQYRTVQKRLMRGQGRGRNRQATNSGDNGEDEEN